MVLASTRQVPADEALRLIGESLADLESAGLIESPEVVATRISPVGSLTEALVDSVLAIENLPEELELKKACFAEKDYLAPPECVLGPSTSGIPASRFTEELAGRARCLVTHPGNPPFLLPVTELVPAPWTAPETVARCRELMADAGQKPIVMNKELQGFVFNRFQIAVVNEAMNLIDQGYVDADDVDTVVRWGLGLRWSFTGPLETLALNAPGGFKDAISRYGASIKDQGQSLMTDGRWSESVVDEIDGALGKRFRPEETPARQAWRDRRLMALLMHKREAAQKFGE